MSNLNLKQLLLCSSLLVATSFASAGIAYAQDADPELDNTDAELLVLDEEELAPEEGDVVVVTGSRIKRDSFSSLSPLQVIDFDQQRIWALSMRLLFYRRPNPQRVSKLTRHSLASFLITVQAQKQSISAALVLTGRSF